MERYRLPEIRSPDFAANGRSNGIKPTSDDLEILRKDLADIKATLVTRRKSASFARQNGTTTVTTPAREALTPQSAEAATPALMAPVV